VKIMYRLRYGVSELKTLSGQSTVSLSISQNDPVKSRSRSNERLIRIWIIIPWNIKGGPRPLILYPRDTLTILYRLISRMADCPQHYFRYGSTCELMLD